MKSINISLPDTMRAYVEELVAQGGYSRGARILSGISATRPKTESKRTTTNHAFRRFELCGEATEMTAQDWEDIRQAVQ